MLDSFWAIQLEKILKNVAFEIVHVVGRVASQKVTFLDFSHYVMALK